ncbi:YoaK family protein [Micromonospora sp. NPDC050417]|uniref:YoaK family protein n=1 Tax=Micromonospora sp. NPDC050417 TaxID=3364280 RepID=UPI003787A03F
MVRPVGPGPPVPAISDQRRPFVATVVLLSLAAGGTDAISLLHLGGIFSSVVTGNIVVLGASATGVEVPTLVRVLAAVGCYGLGVFAGARLTALPWYATPPGLRWRPRAAITCLAIEVLLLIAFWAGWLAAHGAPRGDVQLPLIALAGLAMGMQSVAVRALGRTNLSTTYLTGSLTRIVSAIGTPEWRRQFDGVQALALAGVLIGAGIAVLATELLRWAGPLPPVLFTVTAGGLLLANAIGGRQSGGRGVS